MATFDTRWKNPQGKDPDAMWRWAQDLITELRKGHFLSDYVNPNAAGVPYSNTTSGLTATDVQAAIDENAAAIAALPAPGFVLLNSGTVTNQATLPIVLTSFTAYRGLKLVLATFVPANDDVELWLRVSTNGGSSYDATGYSWTNVWSRDGLASALGDVSGSSNQIRVAGNGTGGESVSNTAAEGGADAEIDLMDQANTGRWPRVRYRSTWFGGSQTDTFQLSGGASRETAQDTDAIEIRFETGNIASGKWSLYGYK